MEVTYKTMELAASSFHFEIVELWYYDESADFFECKFVYATPETKDKYPNVIVGHYPQHSRDHIISPQLCQRAKESPQKFCWSSGDDLLSASNNLPVKTELAIFLDNDIKSNVFLVCFSFSNLSVSTRVLQFLMGLTLSLYISAYFLDDESIGNDLDIEMHATHRDVNIYGKNPKGLSISIGEANSYLDRSQALTSTTREEISLCGDMIIDNDDPIPKKIPCLTPTWEPSYDFSYPVSEIKVLKSVNTQLSAGSFGDMQYLASGSNSDVFRATYGDINVVVKMLKVKLRNSRLALQELNLEHGMLARMTHENIIDFLGAGENPQKLIVLEYLGGGTLHQLLHEEMKTSQVLNFSALFKRKSCLPIEQCVRMARDISSALDYLHDKCWPGACIIHRDLKPDNIGFTESMKLKLFDFGLMTCVKRPATITESYDMTGFTGSLRYMAPEVARKRPYNEKVDVHSFGIILWEMLTGKLPFKGVNKSEFLSEVVAKGFRPKIPKDIPLALAGLLKSCWDPNPQLRPSCESIVKLLDELLNGDEQASPVSLPSPVAVYQLPSKSPSARTFLSKSLWF